jgi:hypothetical protein
VKAYDAALQIAINHNAVSVRILMAGGVARSSAQKMIHKIGRDLGWSVTTVHRHRGQIYAPSQAAAKSAAAEVSLRSAEAPQPQRVDSPRAAAPAATLLRWMKRRGLNQTGFAAELGVSTAAVCVWLQEARLPSPENAAGIYVLTGGAVDFGIRIRDLLRMDVRWATALVESANDVN